MSAAPLRVVPLVGRAVAELGRMLWWVVPFAALAVLAPETVDWVAGRIHRRGPPADAVAVASWVSVWALQLTAVAAAALSRVRGERARLRDTLAVAARRALPAAVASVIAIAAVLAGTAALVLPGLAVLAWLAVAPAAAIAEPGPPWRAVARSFGLTRGYRLRVLAAAGVELALTAAAMAAAFAALEGNAPPRLEAISQAWALTLLSSLPAAGAAVLYEALRATQEAPRGAELERVFG